MRGTLRGTRPMMVAWLIVFVASFLKSDFHAFADDFTVVTQLFASTQENPIGENTTIFSEGNVYDLPASGNQVTFFDSSNKQFVLIDTAQKTQTQVSFEQLLHYSNWLKEKAEKSEDPLLRFCAAPQFEVRLEKGGTLLFFENPLLTYRVEAAAADDPEIAVQYREFSDWYARLNAMFRPQSLLPFPRLMVNQQLAQKNFIPKSVSLQLGPSSRIGKKPLRIRSLHQVRSGLLTQDRERMAWLESCRRKYPEVSLVAYQQQNSANKE